MLFWVKLKLIERIEQNLEYKGNQLIEQWVQTYKKLTIIKLQVKRSGSIYK